MAGYQTLWQKISLLVSANLNALANKALSMNSVAVFDEYLNRMRAELAALQSAEGYERGRIKTLTRQRAALENECGRYDQEIDRLILRGERGLAATRQTTLNTKRGLIDHFDQSIVEAQAEVDRLASARASLGAHIELTESKRLELRALLEKKRAAEMRSRAMAGVTTGVGSAAYADDLLEQVRQDTDVALGKAEASSLTVDARIYEVIGAEDVERQIQEREQRLLAATPVDTAEAETPPGID